MAELKVKSPSSSYFFVVLFSAAASPISRRRGTTVQAASWVIFSPLSLSALLDFLLLLSPRRRASPLRASSTSTSPTRGCPASAIDRRRSFRLHTCQHPAPRSRSPPLLLPLAFVFLWRRRRVAPEESWEEEDVNETASKPQQQRRQPTTSASLQAFFLNSTAAR